MTTYLNSESAFYKYTKGKEFALDGEEYIGEYHYQGKTPYTGPEPLNGAKKLERYHPSKDVLLYIKIAPKQKSFLTYVEPTKGLVYPTENNYNSRSMYRFFVQNRLEKEFIVEIDTDQVSHYSKDNGINPVKYQLLELKWMITRNPKELDKIAFENYKTVREANKEMPGIADYIFSYNEFSEIII
jgi:hypothetical protein